MREIWKEIIGWPEYEVSNLGRIRNSRTMRILKPQVRGKNIEVSLCRPGVQIQKKICFAVLESFVGPCPPGLQCCHWDDDRWNNKLSNLRWDTQSANRHDCMRNKPDLRQRLSNSAKRRYLDPSERKKTSIAIKSSQAWKAYMRRRTHNSGEETRERGKECR